MNSFFQAIFQYGESFRQQSANRDPNELSLVKNARRIEPEENQNPRNEYPVICYPHPPLSFKITLRFSVPGNIIHSNLFFTGTLK